MSFTCNFCAKNFSAKSSLNAHKITANYCLKIQAELTQKNTEEKFKSDQLLIKELETNCIQYRKEIEIYKLEIEKKDKLITKLSLEKSINTTNTTTTNNTNSSSNNSRNLTIMNSLDLSSDKLRIAADNYSFDHYNRTSEGMVEWCVDNLLKDKDDKLTYICNDKNRRNFVYKSSTGELISDPNATKLKSFLKPALTDKLKTHKKLNYSKMAEESDDEDSVKSDMYINIHEENKTLGVDFEKELVKKTYVKK